MFPVDSLGGLYCGDDGGRGGGQIPMCRRFVEPGICVLSGRVLLLCPDYCSDPSLILGRRTYLCL